MIMVENTMNPNQSDPKGAILSGSFAMYDTKEHNQTREDVAKVTGGERSKSTEMSWAEQFKLSENIGLWSVLARYC